MQFLLKCVLSVTVLCITAGCQTPVIPNVAPSVHTGDFPPDLLGQTLDGREIRLSEFKGKVVMLIFWKTWCDACRIELQQVKALMHAYQNVLITVAVNMGEPNDTVRTFKRRYLLDFPVLVDPELKISAAYGIRFWPTTILINQQGRVHFTTAGSEAELLRQEVEILLKEQQGL